MYIWLFSRSVGEGSAMTRNTRGLTRSVIALIVPPFPAPSRPSNTMQTLSPLCSTQSWSFTSSACSFFSFRSYSLRFNGSAPASLVPWPCLRDAFAFLESPWPRPLCPFPAPPPSREMRRASCVAHHGSARPPVRTATGGLAPVAASAAPVLHVGATAMRRMPRLLLVVLVLDGLFLLVALWGSRSSPPGDNAVAAGLAAIAAILTAVPLVVAIGLWLAGLPRLATAAAFVPALVVVGFQYLGVVGEREYDRT